MAIDPIYEHFVADPRNTVRPPPPEVPIEKVRRAANAAMEQGDTPDMAVLSDENIESGGYPVAIRHYRPTDAPELPVIFFCHGGGFVWGNIDTHDGICRRLAAATGAAVISIDYRLAPEYTYPTPVQDTLAVVNAVLDDADAHRVIAENFALCGDSAGGNVMLYACLELVAQGRAPSHLALLYPALDPACDSASQAEFADGPLLTRDAMKWFWDCYLGADHNGNYRMPTQTEIQGLPPTTILTAEIDPLRDEAEKFATQLAEAGTTVRTTRCEGLLHGFLSLPVQPPTVARHLQYEVYGPLQEALRA